MSSGSAPGLETVDASFMAPWLYPHPRPVSDDSPGSFTAADLPPRSRSCLHSSLMFRPFLRTEGCMQ